MPIGVFDAAGSDEPTEDQANETTARGLGYLASGKASDPKNDEKTRGWLAKIDKAVESLKGRRK
jgi:hypothetical protein